MIFGWNLTDDSTTYDKALEYFDKDIFIKPEDSWLSYQLGSLYRKTGEIPKAIEILENILIKNEFKGWRTCLVLCSY